MASAARGDAAVVEGRCAAHLHTCQLLELQQVASLVPGVLFGLACSLACACPGCRGRQVHSYCWASSRHVAHAVVHKEEYWGHVEAFMAGTAGSS
jgi:hypothetical protein